MKTHGLTTHDLFDRLLVVIPTLASIPEAEKSQVRGFMDLHLDILRRQGETRLIALAHYYEQNGDQVPDPDMEIFVDFGARTATATSFQDALRYDHVSPHEDTAEARAMRASLNDFLGQWLCNLAQQGHRIGREGVPA